MSFRLNTSLNSNNSPVYNAARLVNLPLDKNLPTNTLSNGDVLLWNSMIGAWTNGVGGGGGGIGPTGSPGPTGPPGPSGTGSAFTVLGTSSTGTVLVYNNSGVYESSFLTTTRGPTGNILTVAGDILPSQNLTYSLGSTGMRFKDAFFGPATVFIGEASISSIGNSIFIPTSIESPSIILGSASGSVELIYTPSGLEVTGATGGFVGVVGPVGPTGPAGPAGPAGPGGLTVETVTGTQPISTSITTTIVKSGFTHTLATGAADGTLKFIVDTIPRISANNVGQYNISGDSWSALGLGLGNSVFCLAYDTLNSKLYAGGNFTQAGGNPVNRIAQWDGSTWSSVGSGLSSGECYAMVVDSTGKLYVTGNFTQAGGTGAQYVAMWDGANWNALGAGLNSAGFCMTIDSSNAIYIGGGFTEAGGTGAQFVAKWNGSWSNLSSGLSSAPNSLAFDNTNNLLYACGNFTTAGGNPVPKIAKWNGTIWSQVGSGATTGTPSAIGVDNVGNVYVGGASLTQVGGVTVNNIAQFVGGTWSAMGSGIGGIQVKVIYPLGTDIYVGGQFTSAGGQNAPGLAKWDGTWSSVGGGVGGVVSENSLTSDGSNLFAGGSFTSVGPNTLSISSNFWNFATVPPQSNRAFANSQYQGRTLSLIYSSDLGAWLPTNQGQSSFTVTN